MLFASVADTVTGGDDCAVAGFVKLNVTSQAVPDVGYGHDVSESAEFEPVSPVIVTVEPAWRSTSAVSVTVIVLAAPDNGVLC